MKRKFLIFLIPLFYMINYVLYIPYPLSMLLWLIGVIGLIAYPIINMFLFAFVFLDDKLLVWIAPLAGTLAVLWPYIVDLGVDQVAQFSLYAAGIYLPYSLICTVVAVFVRNRERKERGISDEKNR